MRGVVVPFVGLPERTARENLAAYIKHAKALGYFDGDGAIPWSKNTWDLRSRIVTRNNSRTLVLHFFTMATGRLKRSERIPLPEPFAEATRALVAMTILSGKMSAPHRRLMALRLVERAFRELARPADITLLDHAVLDKAASLILENGPDAAGWLPALAQVASEISEKSLSAIPLSWKNPAPSQRNRRSSMGVMEDGGSAISEKLPHMKCVLDLASVFQTAQGGADLVTTAWFALAMFAPSRATEILTLPLACETEMDGIYGLSWLPLKGGVPLTKFATNPEWADVARIAINRLRQLGEPARKAGAWYTENPSALYLPPGFEHLRGQALTEYEIRNILGITEGRFTYTQLNRVVEATRHMTTDPARTGGLRMSRLYEFGSLERFVLKSLPDNFPWADEKQGLLLKDALFCIPRHTTRANVFSHSHVPSLIRAEHINDDLNTIKSTIFVRHDLKDPTTGKHWTLTTHQPRHFLNTLAQSKHLSQALIAFWSGRKRVDQNSWYDHVPHEALIELYVALGENAPRPIKVVGPLADKIAQRAKQEMITPTDAMRLEVGSIIMTRYGLCRHNYALTPCPKDKNCIGCGENTFIKGNQRHLSEARSQLAIAERAIENCLAAIADDEPGVDNWLKKHREAQERWTLVIERMLDPAIEDGTLITLPAPKVSQTKTGLCLNIKEAEPSNELEAILAVAGGN
jgi:hypothetical protein